MMERHSNFDSPILERHYVFDLGLRAGTVCTTIVNFEEQTRGWLTIAAASKTDERLEWAYRQLRELLRSYQKYEVLDFEMSAIMLEP